MGQHRTPCVCEHAISPMCRCRTHADRDGYDWYYMFKILAACVDVEARASAAALASPWLFCTIYLNCVWLDDLRHNHHSLHGYPCFYALQVIDNWTTFAMNVPGHIVCGNDHGKTAILCPREVNHFRRSWVDHERCTAILVGSTMLLTVFSKTAQWP